VSNPFDVLDVARDLVRRDECEFIFDKIRDEHKEYAETHKDEMLTSDSGYARGLEFAMDLLDGRIGFLRDRWG
jgi:hypothetical protein